LICLVCVQILLHINVNWIHSFTTLNLCLLSNIYLKKCLKDLKACNKYTKWYKRKTYYISFVPLILKAVMSFYSSELCSSLLFEVSLSKFSTKGFVEEFSWTCMSYFCNDRSTHTHADTLHVFAEWPVINPQNTGNFSRTSWHKHAFMWLGSAIGWLWCSEEYGQHESRRFKVQRLGGKRMMLWQQQNARYCVCLCEGAFYVRIWVTVRCIHPCRIVFRQVTKKTLVGFCHLTA